MTRVKSPLTPLQIKSQRDLIHQKHTLSPRQAQRMASGRTESEVGEYASPINPGAGVVRRAIEDRKLAKSLGLDPREVIV
jgi:hypothetical protein